MKKVIVVCMGTHKMGQLCRHVHFSNESHKKRKISSIISSDSLMEEVTHKRFKTISQSEITDQNVVFLNTKEEIESIIPYIKYQRNFLPHVISHRLLRHLREAMCDSSYDFADDDLDLLRQVMISTTDKFINNNGQDTTDQTIVNSLFFLGESQKFYIKKLANDISKLYCIEVPNNTMIMTLNGFYDKFTLNFENPQSDSSSFILDLQENLLQISVFK